MPTFGDTRVDDFRFVQFTRNKSKTKTKYEQWLSPEAWKRRCISANMSGYCKTARENNLPIDIDLEYLLSIFPKNSRCPALGILMDWSGNRWNSPSLDRIIPEKGYVKGNVCFISNRANTIKNNATIDELLDVARYMKRID